MRARFGFAFAFPLVLLFACKKEAPPPAASASSSAAPLASAAAPAAGSGLAILKDFEGEIGWIVKGKLAGPSRGAGAPLVLKLLVKGEKFRLDLPAGLPGAPPVGSGYLLGEPQQKKFHLVMDAQKQAVLIDSDKLTAQLESMGAKKAGPAAASDAPEVKKTGKRDTVAGYACEVWQITHKTSKMDLCVAAEDTAWWKLPLAKLPSSYAWATELTDGKHFPLRFVALDKGGAEEGRVELTGIEKKALDAKAFELPAGYQVIDFEQMMAGLTQGFAGMHGRPGAPSLKGLPGLPKGALGNRPSPPTAPKKKP